ncbi:MAG: bifunctional molybdenum cofactor biosynthesis protein MoaC/MoaB [bacterium]
MIDVSPKSKTLRYAKACGSIRAGEPTIDLVRSGKVPKGDVLEVARSAGIAAAKRTSEWIIFCHSLPLDWVDLSFEIESERITVSAEVKSIWRTGVEMEALTAVSAALLNIYDMLKPLDDHLAISDIKLVQKRGGKSDFTDEFDKPLRAAVLVVSDGTFAGKREDRSGKIIKSFLQDQPIEVEVYDVLPDEEDQISARLMELADNDKFDLIFTTGGTGLGPRDVTPEATAAVIEKPIPGIAEAIRKHGKDRTPYAMLSRELCGVRGQCVIVNFPGSSRGAQESLQAIFPGLLHVFSMIRGGGH